MSEKIICIYHANCTDGFGAAWAIHRRWPDAQFISAQYGTLPPDCAGARVLIVDFSYPCDALIAMATLAEHITVIDHHKTAQADLAGLNHPKIKVIFDMERSGAALAWQFAFPDHEVPPLLLHIEDRDLWKWSMYMTREIIAGLNSYPQTFKEWDDIFDYRSHIDLRAEGVVIERKYQQDLKRLIDSPWRTIKIGGHIVPVGNIDMIFASDALHEKGKGKPFAAAYVDLHDKRIFSLRSAPDGLDVSDIAKLYGGGGHKHAAGFKMPIGWEGEK